MNCLRCDRSAHTRGHCERHYRYLLLTGRFDAYRKVDAAEVVDHIRRLRELRWTVTAIHETSGVSMGHVAALARGEYRQVRGDTARKILAVPLVESCSHHGIDPTGTRRRIHGLQWMGWPSRVVADRAGVRVETIYTVSCRGGGRGRCSSRLARAVAAVYDELAGMTGPSQQTATKAQARGFTPPLAWDDCEIDDPKARPRGVRRSA